MLKGLGKTVIKTERLNIRIASDDEMAALIAEQTEEELKIAYGEMLAQSKANPQQRQWYAMWFVELPSGERIGELCFMGLSDEGKTEIGYGLLPKFWGKGYASEAVKAVTEWAVKQGVKTVEAETDAENIASQKVLSKAGFMPTGEIGEEGPRFALFADKA